MRWSAPIYAGSCAYHLRKSGQAERLEAQDRQIAEMAGQLAQLMEVNEALADTWLPQLC